VRTHAEWLAAGEAYRPLTGSCREVADPRYSQGAHHYRVRRDRIDNTGVITIRYDSRLRHIGIGRTHRGKRVIALIADTYIRIVDADTGQLRRGARRRWRLRPLGRSAGEQASLLSAALRRGGGIRTHGPSLPKRVRYQTAPHPGLCLRKPIRRYALPPTRQAQHRGARRDRPAVRSEPPAARATSIE
jgi:hypothetical protein